MKESIRLDYSNMMSKNIGANGISMSDFREHETKLKNAARRMWVNPKNTAFRQLPAGSKEVAKKVTETADWICDQFDTYVLLGIGASALGPRFVHTALNHLYYNEVAKSTPDIYIEDSIDPERMRALLDIIDLKRTCFNVVSKTGTTTETTAQVMVIAEELKKQGLSLANHMVMTTDPDCGSFMKIAEKEGCRLLPIDQNLQGRFCNLTPICLLPAAVGGSDIRAMLEGAADMEASCASQDYRENIALMDGALQYIAYKKGANISVCMPYMDALRYLPELFTIMWDESLCAPGFAGQNVIRALGVADQHSQMPQYIMSPKGKVVTTVIADHFKYETSIPDSLDYIADSAYLAGQSFEKLIKAEHAGNCYALAKAGCMNKTITMSEINAYTIGQLLQFIMLETVYMGELVGADPYNIPAYDDTKAMTSVQFKRKGYEYMEGELKQMQSMDKEYVL